MQKKQLWIIGGALIIVALIGFVMYRGTAQAPTHIGDDASQNIQETETDTQTSSVSTTPKKYATLQKAVDASVAVVDSADYAKAQVVVEGALAEYPNSGSLNILYSTVMDKLGNHAKAVELAHHAVAVDPTNYLTWRYEINLTKATFAGKSPSDPAYKAAISSLYNQALVATHNNIELITPYAIFLEEAGDINGAIYLWQSAKQVNPLAAQSYQMQIDRLSHTS